jgi:glycosyltransferase involved in cell wall biosynthesis
MTLLLDVTYLVARRREPVLTGIDRVEYALAAWLCGEGADIHPDAGFLVNDGACPGVLSRTAMRRILARQARQRGMQAQGADQLAAVADWLDRPVADRGQPGAARLVTGVRSVNRTWSAVGTRWLSLRARPLRAFLRAHPGGVDYVHASHRHLNRPELFAWIKDFDVRATMFVHDLIPITHPQFCGDRAVLSHHRKMATIGRLATRIAVNSHATAADVAHYLAQAGQARDIPIDVHLLGTGAMPGLPPVEAALAGRSAPGRRYYLHAGTLEGRKNVDFLLDLWRRLAREKQPADMPALILAGSRGWHCDTLLRDLDAMTDIGAHVLEVADLNDAELAWLMDHAEAVLTPSFAEGYSLVPAEAMARGVPVLASDIPVHREVLTGAHCRVEPLDSDRWLHWLRSPPARPAQPVEGRRWAAFARSLLQPRA